MKKVGLLVGREWSFPPKFIEEVEPPQRRRRRRVRQARRHADERAVPVRRAHRPHLARGAVLPQLPQARRAARRARRQQPVHVDGRRQVLRAPRWPTSSASRTRRRSCCRTRTTSPASCRRRACATSIYPLDWDGDPRLHRPAVHPQGRPRRRLERRLRLQDASRSCFDALQRLRPAHDGVQEFIEWEHYVRCLCLGREEVLPMQYDPKARQVPRRARPPERRSSASGSSRTR